jgi:hypothetical protein
MSRRLRSERGPNIPRSMRAEDAIAVERRTTSRY